MSQTTIGTLLVLIVAAILVIIFSCLYYLWNKTRKLEILAKKASVLRSSSIGSGNICGYVGKELYEVLRDRKEAPELIEEIKKSYVFYLSRHLEAALEQGMIDQKKSRPSELESDMAVGGTRGEIHSWMPIETLSKFYIFGRSINEETIKQTDDTELTTKLNGLVNEALSEIHMSSYVDRMTDLISRKYLRDMAIDRNS